ncbi:MAG: type II toxin-antitoxin system PemK/MazF family toxin [Parvularculaceae bacterium]
MTLRIKAAPKIRQIYWCDFDEPPMLPEMGKTRPVIIVSYKNVLRGHCLVVPISTDPQEGSSAAWAHKLAFDIGQDRASWVVCNHLYTVSTARLAPFAQGSLRLPTEEFDEILDKILNWLPKIGFDA